MFSCNISFFDDTNRFLTAESELEVCLRQRREAGATLVHEHSDGGTTRYDESAGRPLPGGGSERNGNVAHIYPARGVPLQTCLRGPPKTMASLFHHLLSHGSRRMWNFLSIGQRSFKAV